VHRPAFGAALAARDGWADVAPRYRPLPVELSDVAPVAARVAHEAPFELAPLEPGEAGLHGRVLDEAGVPVADARVLLVGAPHAHDAFQARAQVRTDHAGRFAARTARAGDLWVIAAAPRLRPAHRALVLGEDAWFEAGDPLVLERGATLSGRVLAEDAPLQGIELEAVLARPARVLRIGDLALALDRGRIEWAAPRALTGAGGAWTFEGLAPGERLVRTFAMRCRAAALPTDALQPESLVVPSSGVDLRIPCARLVLGVGAGGEQPQRVSYELEGPGWVALREADANGEVALIVPAGQTIFATLHAQDREKRRHLVGSLRRGEERALALEPGPAPALGMRCGHAQRVRRAAP
jgi:protocatechuate 3,4-dioxygenase beta subunit